MFSIVLVPGAPVFVPEIGGAAAGDQSDSTTAVAGMVAAAFAHTRGNAADPVTIIGEGSGASERGDRSTTLRRWGVDVAVGRGRACADAGVPDALAMAWWWLDRAGVDARRAFLPVAEADPHHVGRRANVLVVADGPAALHPKGPVPDDPRAHELDRELTEWISAGGALPDPGAEVADAVGWWSRETWRILAEVLAPDTRGGVRTADRRSWAPYGVGYHAARWERTG